MEIGRLCLINTSLGHGGKLSYTEGHKDLLRLSFIISQPIQMYCRYLLSSQCPQPQLQSPLDIGHKNPSVSAYPCRRTDYPDRSYYNRRKKNSVWHFHFFFSFSVFLLCCSIFSSVITFKVL